MRTYKKDGISTNTGHEPKAVSNSRRLYEEQPVAYRKARNEEAQTYQELRNVTDILRQTGVKI